MSDKELLKQFKELAHEVKGEATHEQKMRLVRIIQHLSSTTLMFLVKALNEPHPEIPDEIRLALQGTANQEMTRRG